MSLYQKGLVFDAVGTLVYLNAPTHRPFRKMWNYLRDSHLLSSHARPTDLLRNRWGLEDAWMHWCSKDKTIPVDLKEKWKEELNEELNGFFVFPETRQILSLAKENGFAVAVCSNLAAPYAKQIQKLLSNSVDIWVWSIDFGCLKPESEMYEYVEKEMAHLGVLPLQLIMSGCSWEMDVVKPKKQGWRAIFMDRTGDGPSVGALDLKEVLALSGLSRRPSRSSKNS